jgi:hypothetical protein
MLSSFFRRSILVLAVVFAFSVNARGSEFFVSPSGSADGDGNVGNPWSLAFALSHPAAVKPGDTIWLRGGIYEGSFVSVLNGSPDAPIIVRQYPGERAVLDGGNSNRVSILEVSGSYTWYWGFEITSSDPNRVSTQSGSNPTDIGRGEGVSISQTPTTGAGLKFINLIVHDTATSFGFWKEAIDAEVYGCLIYYNGWTAPDRGHGHGVYVQNLTGTKRIADNIIFSNFSHGIHAFGSEVASLDNLNIEGNTIFNNGMPEYARNILVGGGTVAQNPRIVNNVTYFSGTPGNNLDIGYEYGAGVANAVIAGNYVVGGDNFFSQLNTNVTMTGNFFYTPVDSSIQSLFPSNIYSSDSRPTTSEVFVRLNQYEPGRAHVTVVNWANAATVSVDLSNVLLRGAPYEVRNAQDYFRGPILTGTFSGSRIELPMTSLSVASPVGFVPSPSDQADLRVFVLRWRPPLHVDRPPVKPTRPGRRLPSIRRNPF